MAAPTNTAKVESRATMTLNMSRAEMDVIEKLAASHDLSKARVMRQALKVYQLIQARLKPGQQLRFGDEPSKSILFVGPGFEPVDSCTYDGKECYVGRGTDDAHYRCGTSACPHPSTTRATPSQTTGGVETGWLIEAVSSKTGEFTARWWAGFCAEDQADGDGWTSDSVLAMRFARERDAQTYIDETCWTEARPTEHSWGVASPPPTGEPAGWGLFNPDTKHFRNLLFVDQGKASVRAAILSDNYTRLVAQPLYASPPPTAGPTKADVELLSELLDDFDRENADDIANEDFNIGQDEVLEVNAEPLRRLLAFFKGGQ